MSWNVKDETGTWTFTPILRLLKNENGVRLQVLMEKKEPNRIVTGFDKPTTQWRDVPIFDDNEQTEDGTKK